jgi:hypothetical protein
VTGNFGRCRSVTAQLAAPVYAIFSGVPRPTRLGVLNSSPYAYPEVRFVSSGQLKLIDTPQFPAAYKAEAANGGEFLDLLCKETGLDWTFLSPSAMVGPGERAGKFRLGKDQLLTTDKGSSISWDDYAIAAVDELEKPAHVRERFTVGY